MSFAAPEAGFGLNHRVAAIAADALGGVDQEIADADGDVGPAEELSRVAVYGGR